MTTHTKTILSAAAAIASASILPLGVNAQISAFGVYDPAGQPNSVDNDILTLGGIITSQPTGAFGVAAFTTDVATAFANNMGGVIDFESGSVGDTTARLGVVHSLGLNISFTGFTAFTGAANGRIPISGDNRLNGDRSGSIDFGGLFDVATNNPLPDYRISQVGLTMLARENPRDWSGTVTATFSDTTTASYSISQLGGYTVQDPPLANPPEDTFLGFTAPAGLSITAISFNQTGGGQFTLSVDDLGIIAIPEPSTYVAILGLIGLAVVAWRRRVRS
jgi:hypothetical protein